MSASHVRRWVGRALVVLVSLISVTDVRACAVCFGDPDSPMAKGVVAGVFVLVGVVSVVLAGLVGTSLFWVRRGRRLTRSVSTDAPSE